MGYLYETHLHTSEASACAHVSGADYVRPYLDLGFSGIIVTDHFFNSNTAIDRHKPWSEWVKGFCSGYENAKNEGEKIGLDVFFGWEETFDGDDFLIYGLDKNWLLEHPEMVRWTREEQFREVRRYGGCVVHAHPFRQHAYLSTVRLAPHCIDAVEAANAGNHDALYDAEAFAYARVLGLPAVAGSDIHRTTTLGEDGAPFGVVSETQFTSIHDYVSLIRNKGPLAMHIPPGRCDLKGADGNKPLSLKAEIRGAGDKTSGRRRMSFNEVADYILKAG